MVTRRGSAATTATSAIPPRIRPKNPRNADGTSRSARAASGRQAADGCGPERLSESDLPSRHPFLDPVIARELRGIEGRNAILGGRGGGGGAEHVRRVIRAALQRWDPLVARA